MFSYVFPGECDFPVLAARESTSSGRGSYYDVTTMSPPTSHIYTGSTYEEGCF